MCAYFTLGGAMHDAAIAAWSHKGWYDYIRPVSALRWMQGRGQCTDPNLPNYDNVGLPLVDGFCEMVQPGDSDFPSASDVDKLKVRAWKGPEYIDNPDSDEAGVDWILVEDWWPYQRPSFVTPPFAGYVSGHSTFSRAAAEILTAITGDEYFPGGMGEFTAPANEFLVFEDGPSQDIVLQWATYRDASDQCSLSRIWGGIHPPCDDLPGRRIGIDVAEHALNRPCAHRSQRPLSGRLQQRRHARHRRSARHPCQLQQRAPQRTRRPFRRRICGRGRHPQLLDALQRGVRLTANRGRTPETQAFLT